MLRGCRFARAFIGLGILASLIAVASGGVLAQGTATPDTGECTVAPLSAPVWNGVENPEPTAPVSIDGPFEPPAGASADDATIDGVTATVEESIACQNVGDLARTMALFTPEGIASFFSGPRGYDPESVDATIAAGPVPVSEDRTVNLVTVENVVRLDDGRIGATVSTAAGDVSYTDFLFFAEGTTPDGQTRWLIDGSIAIDSQTQVEGGPTEIP